SVSQKACNISTRTSTTANESSANNKNRSEDKILRKNLNPSKDLDTPSGNTMKQLNKCEKDEMTFLPTGRLEFSDHSRTVARPYNCNLCDKSYVPVSNLNRSMSSPTLSINRFNCTNVINALMNVTDHETTSANILAKAILVCKMRSGNVEEDIELIRADEMEDEALWPFVKQSDSSTLNQINQPLNEINNSRQQNISSDIHQGIDCEETAAAAMAAEYGDVPTRIHTIPSD
ncbi:hypothetical protein CEXT_76311, partial [Caerostris extrusa]